MKHQEQEEDPMPQNQRRAPLVINPDEIALVDHKHQTVEERRGRTNVDDASVDRGLQQS